MSKAIDEYYLGLDIGTSSVGWAVTDPQYNILEYKGKALWGIHLFDEGNTAEDRRMHRCARRRLNRRKQRTALLRELFDKEICKVDPSFFQRLDESALHIEDKSSNQSNSLFNDQNFKDKDFHKKFPTIYHLRDYLMKTTEKPDIRLVYLAIHHIIKYRGHFLFETSSEDLPKFEDILSSLIDDVQKYDMNLCVSDGDCDRIKELISNRSMSVIDKKRELYVLMDCHEGNEKELVNLLSGSKANLGKLFSSEDLSKESFKLTDSTVDDQLRELEDVLDPDCFNTLRIAKNVFDWGVMTSILGGKDTLSEAMVAIYDQHKSDLALLKSAVKQYSFDRYANLFKSRSKSEKGNYTSYSGKGNPDSSCDQKEFCKYCLNIIGKSGAASDPKYKDMFDRLNAGTFMPKQVSKDNAVLPYTIHRKDLKRILVNVSKFYPFLNERGSDGFTVAEKILSIQEFRVPYYVGPLSPTSNRSWVVRDESKRITPWNFSEVVNEDESAKNFIDNLTSMCTYLVGEKVLPKNSLIYSYYSLYNELNNIRINGERLDVNVKKAIVKELFENSKVRVTEKKIGIFLVKHGFVDKKDTLDITGINGEIKTVLPLGTLKSIIPDKVDNVELCEKIIFILTVFNDPKRVSRNLRLDCGKDLTDEEIKRLSKLRFEGWGRLSRKLLTELVGTDRLTGKQDTILGFLENTQRNFMEILSECGFNEMIDKHNRALTTDDRVTYQTLENMYFSPAVRRAVWRTVSIVNELVGHLGHVPAKLFVETTRGPQEKKPTSSRKTVLLALYRSCKEDPQWISDLESKSDSDLKSRKVFLYYTQLGRCMYCGKKISFEDLNDNNLVNREHIYPQSKLKDDSIYNNMVLTHVGCNQDKKDVYPLDDKVQTEMRPFWDQLLNKGYITKEKYARLVRRDGFSDEELAKFISRQLVETSQSAKGSIEVLRRILGEGTDIVYVKAGLVSEFRQLMDSPVMEKCRSVNDYHHAKDAYLNIVVGNVYDVKFTKDYGRFIHSKEKYNLRRLYDFDVQRNGIVAWKAGEGGTRSTVLKYMRRNNILFTKRQYVASGALFNDNLVKAKENASALKERKIGLSPEKYGGYNKPAGACYSLVEYTEGNRIIRSFEVLYLNQVALLEDPERLNQYYSERLNKEVKVVIACVRMNALLDWGGIRVHLGGRTNDNVVLYNATQLLMDDKHYHYCKQLFRFNEDVTNRIIHSAQYYGFTKEDNLDLYEFFIVKVKTEPYCYLPAMSLFLNNLLAIREQFEKTNLVEQVTILNELLHPFQCNPTSANLKCWGGSSTAGRNVVNKKLPMDKKVILINQSITGLIENTISLN